MNMKYNLIKLGVVVVNIGFLLYQSISNVSYRGIGWQSFFAAVILVFLIVKSVPFMKGQENTWVFLISLVAIIPFNVKVSYGIVFFFFEYLSFFSKVLYSILMFMCLLAIEEISLGILARFIWNKQEDPFGNEKITEYDC